MEYDASTTSLRVCFNVLKKPMGEKQIAFAKRLVGPDAAIFLDRLDDRQIGILTCRIGDSNVQGKWFRKLSGAYIKLCMQRMGRIRWKQASAGGSLHVSLDVMIEALNEEKKKTKD